jgi:uncharacterized protein
MFCSHRIILSVDGCGFKGIVPLKILSYLHASLSKEFDEIDTSNYVDLFTSTSASSIFTGALMLKNEEGKSKYTPNDLLNFYLEKGDKMFSKNIGLDAENSIYPLSFVLDYFFGNVKLKDINNHFLFYSFDEIQNEIYTFSKMNDRLYNVSLSKIMNACTVDGTVFPPVSFGNSTFIDASFMLKNPSLLAYNYMKTLYPNENIILISIGFNVSDGVCNTKFQGLHQIDAHQELLKITKEDKKLNYFRFEPILDEINNDSNEEIYLNEKLLEITEKYIETNQTKFNQLLQLMLLRTA